jgi:hypothetical protein
MPGKTPAAAMLERVRSYYADLTGIRRLAVSWLRRDRWRHRSQFTASYSTILK